MAWVVFNQQLGEVAVIDVDPAGPGPYALVGPNAGAMGRSSFYNEIVSAWDQVLGSGQFVYAQAVSAVTPGQVVQFQTGFDTQVRPITQATVWTGTAYSGRDLAVAVIAIPAGQWGWFQVGGFAIVATSGTVASGVPLYWQANGVLSATAVAGKHLIGAQAASANGATVGSGTSATVLTANQSLVLLSGPVAQGQNT